MKKKLKNYLVKVNIELDVEAENDNEAIEEFWKNMEGSLGSLEKIIRDSITVEEIKS